MRHPWNHGYCNTAQTSIPPYPTPSLNLWNLWLTVDICWYCNWLFSGTCKNLNPFPFTRPALHQNPNLVWTMLFSVLRTLLQSLKPLILCAFYGSFPGRPTQPMPCGSAMRPMPLLNWFSTKTSLGPADVWDLGILMYTFLQDDLQTLPWPTTCIESTCI